jgi:hypothetical protein
VNQQHFLECRPATYGLGVFALKAIKPGQRLLEFTGPVIRGDALEAALESIDVDGFLQISSDSYIGLSGGLDDFVNHACEPNCGLQFLDSGIVLTAIRAISADEEITFDYASTQNAYPYRFSCGCGSATCRQDIGDFDDLPDALKWKYHHLGILAPYLSAETAGSASLRRVRSGHA